MGPPGRWGALMDAVGPSLLISTELGASGDGLATAAAVAVALAARARGAPVAGARGAWEPAAVALVELGPAARRRPTLLSSTQARVLEGRLAEAGLDQAAARGGVCWVGLPRDELWVDRLAEVVRNCGAGTAVAHLSARQWRLALDHPRLRPRGALLRADPRLHRPLLALAVRELRGRGIGVRVATRPLGMVGSRRALAGLDPGGSGGARVARIARALAPGDAPERPAPPPAVPRAAEVGQALPLVLGAAFVTVLVALVLAAL
jgi:hypothetical protein